MKAPLSHDATEPYDYEPPAMPWESMTLTEIADAYQTDKGTLDHRYTEHYAKYLDRTKPIRLLEIGVACGASLKMWSRYMPQAHIVGMDTNKDCVGLCKSYPNIKIVIGDATRMALTGPWDVIIDDGSHIASDMAATVKLLWPHLRDDGLYVIEDTACTMRPSYQRPGKLLGDEERIFYSQIVDGFLKTLDAGGEVEFVHAYRQLLVVRKRPLPAAVAKSPLI